VVDEGGEAVGPHGLVDEPVAETGGVVAAAAEPAVVEHVPFHADARRGIREALQARQVVVEVDRLPGVEGDRARGGRMRRPGPQRGVEPCGQGVQPVAPRGHGHRGGVVLARGEAHLAGAQQLAGLQHSGAGDEAFGGEAVVAAPGEVHGVHQSALEAEARGARREQEGGVGTGAALAALPLVAPGGEAVALRNTLAQVAAGGVEQLGGRGGHGQGGAEVGQVVGVGARVGEGEALAHEARVVDPHLGAQGEAAPELAARDGAVDEHLAGEVAGGTRHGIGLVRHQPSRRSFHYGPKGEQNTGRDPSSDPLDSALVSS
jgi:hypothetical protein